MIRNQMLATSSYKRITFTALAAVLMAACTKDEVPIVSVVEAEPLSLPAECTAPDAAWKELPEEDVVRSEAVKNYDTNKGQYNRILNRRSVCRAAINALSSKG